ncbi:uncharacterized protein LOC126013629 [Suncus etruscus]|uniref:uncharacterized protein LOC126013629 n=1 Tax=Suncus etruscus TaxID=109475 RepID=UPI0021100F29|nr:uncharacterized protein LOC126013629 [Suncus etruscus]
MSSPSQTPNPSPTQSPSQSRSHHSPSKGYRSGTAPSPSPTRGSTRVPSHPATPPTASQPSSRGSSLTPSPHVQHVARGSGQVPTPPTSKSPSQSGFKVLSRNPSLTPAGLVRSPSYFGPAISATYIGPARAIPSQIAPYVPRFLKEPPFFQPPTSQLPQNQCFPCPFPCQPQGPDRERAPPPDSLYFPLLPPPPRQPQTRSSFPTPPALFTPPSSLSYTLPPDVLVSGKPHVVPTSLPATFYTPFSRFYTQPRPRRARRLLTTLPGSLSLPPVMPGNLEGAGRSVHFFRDS